MWLSLFFIFIFLRVLMTFLNNSNRDRTNEVDSDIEHKYRKL